MRLNKAQYTTRRGSAITGGKTEHLHTIKDFPVFIGSTSESRSKDLFHDLIFDICKDTGVIQLRNPINLDIVYSKYHCEALGKVWIDHHDKFSDILSKYCDNKRVLEIGGSDSRIALNSLSKNKKISNWTIIEPTIKNKIDNSRLSYIEDFFSEKCKINDVDVITHSHVIEHMYDPKSFLENISKTLKKGDYHIFAAPNLYLYLKNRYSNVINFEHTLFLTEKILDYLLSVYGFKIEEKIYYVEHSIFYVTKKTDDTITAKQKNYYVDYKNLYLESINYYKNFVEDVNKKIKHTSSDVYLFGAHVFSQLLISLGLKTKKIINILDNSEIKNGQRLYGTNMMIKMPKDTKIKDESIIILKVGQYQEEIKRQLLNINEKIKFYE